MRMYIPISAAILVLVAAVITISAQLYIEPNPGLNQSCGVDMVLVIDSSGSIDSAELGQMKVAYESFINAFLPATPTLIGVVDFDTQASVAQNFTDNVTVLTTAVNTPTSGGFTNWQDALLKARGLFDPRGDKPNLVVFASDGNPNRRGDPAEAVNQTVAVQAAVTEANLIKANGTRIIALGIGNAINTANLEAISSPDAVITSNFTSLADTLAELSAELCGGTITVKKIINSSGVQDWEFNITIEGGTSNLTSGLTDSEGFINFEIEFNDTNATVNVSETLQEGYLLDQASCSIGNTTLGYFDGVSVFNISIGVNDIVYCEFINILAPICGDGNLDQGETCDMGENNTDTPCDPPQGGNCSYCDTSCEYHTITGPFCGDGIVTPPEECDGLNGTGPNQACSDNCTLENLTYCGDGIVTPPEQCDGTNGTGPHQSCSQNCTLENLTYCGDGIKQTPNDEGTGGPQNDGYEECDGSDGVGQNQACTASCVLETTEEGCTLTQGYWKNHGGWPSPYEQGDTFFNSGESWIQILKSPPKGGDAYLILAHQYIAYKLNQASGANLPGDLATQAEGYLNTYNPTEVPKKSADRSSMIELAGTLDQYNNGLLGPGHCDG
jgi:cysteine-rich repeat protein